MLYLMSKDNGIGLKEASMIRERALNCVMIVSQMKKEQEPLKTKKTLLML